MNDGMELTYVFRPRRAFSVESAREPDIYGPFEEGPWMEAPPIGELVDRGRPERAAELGTEVRLCHTKRALYAAFRCVDDLEVKSEDVRHNQLSHKGEGRLDWIEVLLDAGHDHLRALRLKLDANGHLHAWRILRRRGELPGNVDSAATELAHGGNLHTAVRITDSGWEGAAEIPYAKVGLDASGAPGPVLGFDFERVSPAHRRHWRWGPGVAGTDSTPLEYGDLYLGAPAWSVREVDLGEVVYEGSPLRVTLEPSAQAGGSGEADIALTTRVVMPYDNEVYDERSVERSASRSEPCEIETEYALSHRGRWPVEMEYVQRLEVELTDRSSGQRLYAGSYPFHCAACIKPGEAYGTAREAPDPGRSDPDFLKKKRRYVASRVPKLIRRRTTDGAPSDFTLTAADGSYEFNLMEAGALQRMADMIEELFEVEDDRLVAAMLLIHQRTVTRHASAYTRLFPMSPLSVLRAGGGICGVRSPALCGLISLMKSPRTGEPYRTRVLEIAGHTVTGVLDSEGQPDSEMVVLDADVGLFFYVPDNSRLAKLADLERDRSIAYRSNVNNFKYDHEMFSDAKFHHTHGWPYHGSWPEGAPEW